MKTIIGVLIGACVTIIATFFSYLLSKRLVQQTHANALQLLQKTEFNKAAAIFRAAFVNEIFLLQDNIETGNQMPTHIIHHDILISHEKANILFEPFLPAIELESFNAAWEKYKRTKNDYIPKGEDTSTKAIKPKMSMVYLDHINHLLDFAKPKL